MIFRFLEPKILDTKIVHTTGKNYDFWGSIFFDLWGRKMSLKYVPYTEKYTESESDIQSDNLLYKRHQQCQNTFLKNTEKKMRKSNFHTFQKNRFQNDQRFMKIFVARLWRA